MLDATKEALSSRGLCLNACEWIQLLPWSVAFKLNWLREWLMGRVTTGSHVDRLMAH